MTEEKLPRREREKIRQREEILEAALSLFSEKGYHNVSMQEIAESSEFAVGTLYKFFPTKEELYKALVEEQVHSFQLALSESLQVSEDEVEQLRSYIRTKGETFRGRLPFMRLYMSESWVPSFTGKNSCFELARTAHRDILEELACVFERGIERKRFKAFDNPFHLAVALDSAVNGLLLLLLSPNPPQPYPEDPEHILELFLNGVVAQ